MAEITRVLKVESSAVTASFRYPHIMIGRLPTFEMPPPATIYGHLSGVLGEWFEPKGLKFAYTFTHQGIGEDIELGHMIEINMTKKDKNLNGLPKNVEGSLNPQRRNFLFRPRMTLYLSGDEEVLSRLKKAFLSPAFAYILGRTQDLATCHSAEWVELAFSDRVFYSNTLLPWSLRQWVLPGVPVFMPESINYQNLREPRFERYLQLTNRPLRIFGEGVEDDIISREPFNDILVDSTETRIFNNWELPRGVWFHDLKGMGV